MEPGKGTAGGTSLATGRPQAGAVTSGRPAFDVVVPVRPGDHAFVVHCLTSLLLQSLTPGKVVLVDDGGAEADHSLQLAAEFGRANGLQVECISRRWTIGHVATLKRQARESSGQVLLVLQPGTVLNTPDYIEACLATFADTSVACAAGRAAVLQPGHRSRVEQSEPFRRWIGDDPYLDPLAPRGAADRLARWLSAAWLAHVQDLGAGLCDRIGERTCGGIMLATGGAVAYRCRYLRDLFDRVEPVRGDDLGAWPGHAIAHAFATEGYRMVRVGEAEALVQPPPLARWPSLAWSWLLGLLQAGHWFDPLLRSPFRRLARYRRRKHAQGSAGARYTTRDEVIEEPFGERVTRLEGRPVGGALLLRAVVLAGLGLLAWVLGLSGRWAALGGLALVEVAAVALLLPALAGRGERGATAVHALVATPLRWGVVLAVPPALARMVAGLWLGRAFRWRRVERRRSARGC